jgi:hypothetical protein
MSPVLPSEGVRVWNQLVTLAGVIIGASISYLFTARAERSRNRREMVIRWDVRKYEAFTEYLAAVTRMARLAGQLVRDKGWDPLAASVDEEEGRSALDAFESDRTAAYEKVVMLGDESSISAADSLNRAVWKLEWVARGAEGGSKEEWESREARYTAALDMFQRAARMCLVVPLASFERRIEHPELPAPRAVPEGPGQRHKDLGSNSTGNTP